MPHSPSDSEPTASPPAGEEFTERREHVRRSVLRANRAVAVILAVVVVLGIVLVAMSLRARRHQIRAENAETEATERLWRASLAQARAENLSTQSGHRAAALEAVRTAAQIRPSLELRNEAIAALSQRDFLTEREWIAKPNPYGFNFDPDLKYYVVRYDPTVLSLYRLEDNAHIRDFPMPLVLRLRKGAHVGDFQFSATGKFIAIRYNGGLFTISETETGRVVRMIGLEPRLQRWSWPPSFSADDRFLCMNMAGSEGEYVLYDIENGEPVKLPQWPADLKWAGGTTQVAVSPRGDRLAWFKGAEILVLHAASGAVLKSTTAPSQVQAFNWDEQGSRISFQSDNFALSVWDVDSGRVTQMGGTAVLAWHQRFSPDGRMLLTTGMDGTTRLWDVPTARLICQTNAGRGLTFNRAGDHIGCGVPGKSVGLWRIAQPAATRYFQGSMRDRATVWQHDITDDARLAVWTSPGWSGNTGMDLIDLDSGGIWHLPMTKKASVGFHPAKRQLWMAEAGEGLHLVDLPPGGLPQNTDWMKNRRKLPLPAGFTANGASFSADGRYAAVSGGNAGLLVLDTESTNTSVMMERGYRSHDSIPGPGSRTGSGAMCISPDGRWVAAGRYTDGNRTTIWDARTGKIIQRLTGVYNSHIVFSPDSQWLFVAGTNGSGLWSTGKWQQKWMLGRPPMLDAQSVGAFSADGSLIAWNRGVIKVELIALSGEPVATLDVEELGYVAGIRFAAEGRKLFLTGMEGRMITVDVPSLRSQLAEMKLDWQLPPQREPQPDTVTENPSFTVWTPALLTIVPVGIVAVLGALVLRRQRRLTTEFVETTEVAARRTQELAAEREVGELKSRFVTMVSHEFRTPLGITMSAVELLRHYEDRLPPEEKVQLFDDIHTATRNMAGLMEQVLVLGRVDAGKLAYRPAPLDLDVVARKLADESLSATNRKCPIEWTAENDLSGARADEALLRHIFTNLISNGVKYSPSGSAVQFTGRREGRDVVFTVRDNGIGIPEADLPNLFEAFHRAGNVGEIPGTGLGLVISKRCAELHGGSISVATKPGEGATFTVRIPAW